MKLLALAGVLIGAALSGCADPRPLATVPSLDLDRYKGEWFSLARYPHRFERDLSAVSAVYVPRADGSFFVLNQGRRPDGTWTSISGSAWRPEAAEPGRLEVQFFWPFSGGYHVIGLDPGYRWAVVGHPSREYLWFLARAPAVDAATWTAMRSAATAQGYDLTRLEPVPR